MKELLPLLVLTALAAPAAAQPKPGGCPTVQAETVHLYLKATRTASGGSGASGGGAAGMAIDELGMPIDKKDKKGKSVLGGGDCVGGLQTQMLSAARRAGFEVDPSRLEYVLTHEGAILIVPTAGAIAGKVAPGDPVMLLWTSIPTSTDAVSSGFLQVTRTVDGAAPGTAGSGPRLPASLQREIALRLRGGGGTGDPAARFVYRPLPSMPPPVLTPMDVADPPLNWPH